MNDSEAFLDRCRQGSGAAYDAFKELLARLDDPSERAAARRLLGGVVSGLFAHVEATEQQETFHVAVRRLPTGAASPSGAGARDDQDELTLLQLPGVFAPEEWSYTFFEGLARYPAAELEGLTVAELGCGNGWISLALARRSLPRKVWALDVNPRAAACARLNLYVNALDDRGEPILDASGRSLLDRVEVAVSDLLARCREAGERLDRVVGCIPQVLRPDLDLTREAVSETASDEFLYSLSNYTGKQGHVEDQFGLGLIARAVEESVELLRPAGHMIFNLGGRPGRGVLRRLFERRGVEVREVWTTTIPQAGDTDIRPLVEIERSTPHRFEFYLGRHAEEPVSATTALAYLRAGGAISHSLTVFDGRVRFPSATRRILGHLAGETFRAARSALDLAYPDDAQAEEKASFLARLADDLGERRAFPYGPTGGDRTLRRHLAEYLHRYFGVSLDADRLVVAPSRQALVANLLTLYRPERALLDPELARHLPCCLTRPAGQAERDERTEVLEGVRRADLACRLIEALRPGLAVVVPAETEARSVGAFERLIETAEAVSCRLVIDLSPHFELSSTPAPIGVFRALAERPLPPHTAIVCGLIKNRVYADLEVAFLATEDPDLLDALAGVAEVTYSRAPALAQRYYDVIVEELLAFRIGREEARAEAGRLRGGAPQRPRSAPEGGVESPPLAPSCSLAFEHPAMVAERLPIDAGTVRFDYGENSLPAPDVVREALSESFARQNLTEEEVDPSSEIRELLARRLGFLGRAPDRWSDRRGNLGSGAAGGAPSTGGGRILLGLGAADLFAALLRGGMNGGDGEGARGTVLFPAGSYGFFVAAVQLFGGRPASVETDRRNRFKMTPERLEAALAEVSATGAAPVWLFLNAPVVNPTGALYTPDEVEALLGVAASRGVPVILDAIFSGLETEPDAHRWHLDGMIERTGAELVVLGGLAKELAAGGIRMGWAATASPAIAAALDAGQPSLPHSTIRFATRRMVARLIDPEGTGASTAAQLADQRSLLAERARRLSRVLEECGWEPLPAEGGLFLVARPSAYLGKTIEVETDEGPRTLTLDAQSITDALFWSERLLVNGDVWTGIPGWCRFVYAVEEAELAEGIERLRRFARRMEVGPR